MQSHSLKAQGFGCVSISLDASMWGRLQAYVESKSKTRIKIFEKILVDFILNHQVGSFRYLSTLREDYRFKVSIWIAPQVFSHIKAISERDRVSLRAVVYTAIVDFFDKIEEGKQLQGAV